MIIYYMTDKHLYIEALKLILKIINFYVKKININKLPGVYNVIKIIKYIKK
jgi:hypothetical protein